MFKKLFSFFSTEEEKPRKKVSRDFYVNRENVFRQLEKEYEITRREFNKDYANVVADYYDGADTIIDFFQFCVNELRLHMNDVWFNNWGSILSLSLFIVKGGNTISLTYNSYDWYEEGGVMHRICTLEYGNCKLKYDITNGTWDDWWSYADNDENVYVNYKGVRRN